MNAPARQNTVRPAQERDAEPYDASNPEHVKIAKKKAEIREDLRREGLRYIMSDRRGRAWMHHLLNEKLFMQLGEQAGGEIMTGSSYTYFNAAFDRLGKLMQQELKVFCRDEFDVMEREGDQRARER